MELHVRSVRCKPLARRAVSRANSKAVSVGGGSRASMAHPKLSSTLSRLKFQILKSFGREIDSEFFEL